MKKVGGGMEFAAGRLTAISPPPGKIPTHAIRLRVSDRPEVHAGQTVRQGQPLTMPRQRSRGYHVSPLHGTVRRMEPVEESQTDSEVIGRQFEIEIAPSEPTAEPSIAIDPPKGREVVNWLSALREIDSWSDYDGGVGLLPQMEAALLHPPDAIILNGLDRFPPYPDFSSLLASFPDDAIRGMSLLGEMFKAKRWIVAVSRHVKVTGRLRSLCRKKPLRLVTVNNVYPMADPTLLVWSAAPGRRRLPPGSNPISRGVLVVRPWTVIRLGRWLAHQRFELARPMLLAWPEPGARMSVRYAMPGQPLGTLHERIAGSAATLSERFVFGHPMNGRRCYRNGYSGNLFDAVVPGDEMLVTLLGPPAAPAEQQPCISCGWCAQVCPTRLRPAELYNHCRRGGPADLLLNQLTWCIDCGLCTHVCPSAIPLSQTFRQMAGRFGRMLK